MSDRGAIGVTAWFTSKLKGIGYLPTGPSQNDCEDDSARSAIAASDASIDQQRSDGGWDYPNPEWRGRVATVEGIWACLGLLETYRRTQKTEYLDAVHRWDRFFQQQIGFQDFDGMCAVNYFAGEVSEPVPNNAALALRYLSSMAAATGDASFLQRCPGLIKFIATVQSASGEVPYTYGLEKMEHFQCFQYQSFLLLDLLHYHLETGDPVAVEVVKKISHFLTAGIAPEGFAHYQCGNPHRTVNYHTSVVASALTATGSLLKDRRLQRLGDIAFRYVLSQQDGDGSFPHSRGDYRCLRDRRRYPRYLAMMALQMMTAAKKQIHQGPRLASGRVAELVGTS